MGETNKKNGQAELIKELKERLHWYTYEASPEEFDEEVVCDIVNLLNKLEPCQDDDYFNPEKGLERFWKYCERREAAENAGLNELKNREDRIMAEALRLADSARVNTAVHHGVESNAGCTGDNKVSEFAKSGKAHTGGDSADGTGKKKGRLLFFGKHKGLAGTCAAAILVLLVSVAGVGASASKNTGLFHWLSKDETGREAIVNTGSDNENFTINRYVSTEDLPDSYSDMIKDINGSLYDIELSYIETTEVNNYSRITSYYKNDELDLHLEIMIKKYTSNFPKERVTDDSFQELKPKDFKGILVDRYELISDDETEYLMSFTYNQIQCVIRGNLEIERMEDIVNEYIIYLTFDK